METQQDLVWSEVWPWMIIEDSARIPSPGGHKATHSAAINFKGDLAPKLVFCKPSSNQTQL